MTPDLRKDKGNVLGAVTKGFAVATVINVLVNLPGSSHALWRADTFQNWWQPFVASELGPLYFLIHHPAHKAEPSAFANSVTLAVVFVVGLIGVGEYTRRKAKAKRTSAEHWSFFVGLAWVMVGVIMVGWPLGFIENDSVVSVCMKIDCMLVSNSH